MKFSMSSRQSAEYLRKTDEIKDYPGVIIVEIDGLAYEVLCEAVERGEMPNLKKMIEHVYHTKGAWLTIQMLDAVKACGYKNATFFGATLSMEDIIIPLVNWNWPKICF